MLTRAELVFSSVKKLRWKRRLEKAEQYATAATEGESRPAKAKTRRPEASLATAWVSTTQSSGRPCLSFTRVRVGPSEGNRWNYARLDSTLTTKPMMAATKKNE